MSFLTAPTPTVAQVNFEDLHFSGDTNLGGTVASSRQFLTFDALTPLDSNDEDTEESNDHTLLIEEVFADDFI